MQFSDLSVFASVAAEGSITRAAQTLNTVQSNVTGRIKVLEREVGASLLHRHSRGVTLTEAGRRLLPYALRIVALTKEAKRAACDDGTPRGSLRLGSMETTAAIRLPPVLAGFHRLYPDVQLEIVTGTTASLLQDVLEYRLDAALVAGPVDVGELDSHRVFEEELVLVTAPGWREPGPDSASGGPTLVVFRHGCAYRQRLEQFVTSQGWLPFRRLEFGTLDGILGCVAADVGVTLLPRVVVARMAAQGRVSAHALPPEQASVDTMLVRRREAFVGSAMLQFLADVERVAA
jgi:DNA-binding transcriptional LysR family regulator